MAMLPLERTPPKRRGRARLGSWLALCGLASLFCLVRSQAQDDQLNQVHVPAQPTAAPAATGAPAGAEAPAVSGPDALKIHPGARIRLNVDMVLVPVTITDPMNRLVTGLEQEDFQVFENNVRQRIATFASEDAPVSIGIIFDLSGSMSSKLIRARQRPAGTD
jgi:Ca-activated chloride channel family protein